MQKGSASGRLGDVLIQRTVGDVLPDVQGNLEQLEQVCCWYVTTLLRLVLVGELTLVWAAANRASSETAGEEAEGAPRV